MELSRSERRRGASPEFLMGYYAILDRAPKGRDEHGEMWLRRHDEYDA
jgi:predicted dithiol-disulfide oxidoreductase (DUF899 family)